MRLLAARSGSIPEELRRFVTQAPTAIHGIGGTTNITAWSDA